MNAMILSAPLLPACLVDPSRADPRHRRYHVGEFRLSESAVDRFNRHIERFGASGRPVDGDRIATAARQLSSGGARAIAPPCIRSRLRWVKAALSMVADPVWKANEESVDVTRHVARYVASSDDLIPDALPAIGRLDDALVVDAAWPLLREDVVCYVDFRRLRRVCATPGSGRRVFDRNAWLQAREEDAQLQRHLKEVRGRSYCMSAAPLFAVR